MDLKLNLKWVVLFLVIHCSSIITVNGLKCYKCNDCELTSPKRGICPNDYACMKAESWGLIIKNCAPKTLCNNIPENIGSVEPDAEYPKIDFLECCTTDLCNAGNVPANWMGLSGALSISLLAIYFLGYFRN